MKAEDLRIGNYINYQGRIQKVHSLNMNQIRLSELAYNDYNSSVYKDNIKPIPLTEEWLINFGFEKNTEYVYFTKEIVKHKEFILARDLNKSTKESYFLCDCDVDTDLKYVHQLQNLYHALTNKELTIK